MSLEDGNCPWPFLSEMARTSRATGDNVSTLWFLGCGTQSSRLRKYFETIIWSSPL